MRKVLVVTIIFIIFVIPGHLNLSPEDIAIYVSKADLYKELFKEPFEILLLQTWDGKIYTLSNRLDNQIIIPIYYLKEILAKDGYKISDLIVVIHNHHFIFRFSKADLRYYRLLKQEGFHGLFLLYLQSTGGVKRYVEINGKAEAESLERSISRMAGKTY